ARWWCCDKSRARSESSSGGSGWARRRPGHVAACAGVIMRWWMCAIALMLGVARADDKLRVGAAQTEFEADDAMVIGGGILPGKATGQEGKLRAVAVVVQKPPSPPVALCACDVLMLNRDLLDPVAEEIEKATGIPASHILINATHTHHAPSTCTVHGYARDEIFCRRVQQGIVAAVKQAYAALGRATLHF